MAAVGHGGGTGHAALGIIEERRNRSPQPLMPSLVAAVAVEAHHVQFALLATLGGRDEHALVPHDGIRGPRAGRGVFQSTLSVADHWIGTPESFVTPVRSGPRHPASFQPVPARRGLPQREGGPSGRG